MIPPVHKEWILVVVDVRIFVCYEFVYCNAEIHIWYGHHSLQNGCQFGTKTLIHGILHGCTTKIAPDEYPICFRPDTTR